MKLSITNIYLSICRDRVWSKINANICAFKGYQKFIWNLKTNQWCSMLNEVQHAWVSDRHHLCSFLKIRSSNNRLEFPREPIVLHCKQNSIFIWSRIYLKTYTWKKKLLAVALNSIFKEAEIIAMSIIRKTLGYKDEDL